MEVKMEIKIEIDSFIENPDDFISIIKKTNSDYFDYIIKTAMVDAFLEIGYHVTVNKFKVISVGDSKPI